MSYPPPRSSRAILAVLIALALAVPSEPTKGATEEVVFDAALGLGDGWRDLGWAPRELAPGRPAKLDLSDRGGWILSRKELSSSFAALVIRYQAPARFGDFLEVRLDSSRPGQFPRVVIGRDLQKSVAGGWTEAAVPFGALNPHTRAFEQVVLRTQVEVGHDPVLIQHIGLIGGSPLPAPTTAAAVTPAPVRAPAGPTVRFVADCRARPRPISPLIYGTGSGDPAMVSMGATAMRWGGNPTTRYNWQLGNAWNVGSDWYFKNVETGPRGVPMYEAQLQKNLANRLATALTVPTIGWVAKDTTSYSFPVSLFGAQESVAPENPDIGNGKSKAGALLPPQMPPSRTSVAAPPEFIGKWLATIRETDRKRGRSVKMVILDNEPMAWHQTHRDVHPTPLGYDEYFERTVKYATAIRKAYPDVQIAGPAEWGWSGYFYSAIDIAAGTAKAPDRRAHGNAPLLPWWLAKVRDHERRTGTKLIDILDVHYYPQGQNIGFDRGGGTDPATNALRLRSTRSLWDPTYVDESWIKDRVELLPRLKRWVAANAPGLGISLGEYSFGAGDHQSGGLAEAEALGRFGIEGLTSAFYWFMPAKDSPAYWAFRAYRNFDGKGGRFLDLSVPVRGDDPRVSLFLSRSESSDHLVAVLLNLDPDQPLNVEVDLSSCGPSYGERAFGYAGGPAGFAPAPASRFARGVLHRSAGPYSMTAIDLTAAP